MKNQYLPSMKSSIILLLLLFSSGCHPRHRESHTEVLIMYDSTEVVAPKTIITKEEIPEESSKEPQKGSIKLLQLSDTLKADFNGDGKIDQAVFRKEEKTSGIIICHGGSDEVV
ncbi:MAG: hypothetical protein AAF740_05840, partial [Bacteroidota bacterium]